MDKEENNRIFLSLYLPAVLILGLVMIQLYQYFIGSLGFLGIFPRRLSGLIGVITAPLVHGDFMHLLSNSIPLFICCFFLIYSYKNLAYKVFILIYLGTGLFVWIFARPNLHIGASGVIYGLVGFLFLSGLIRKNTNLLAIALLIIFLYGSLVYGILPFDLKISWESHLFGLFLGFLTAVIYRNDGPPPPVDPFENEVEEEMEINNVSRTDQVDINQGININSDTQEI